MNQQKPQKPPFDVSVGRYDVTISVGPSFQSKRQESVAGMMDLVHGFPQVFPVIGDLMVGNMDWPGAKEMAKRLKAMLPPEVQQMENGDPVADLQKCQAQLQQAMQQHQQMTQVIQQQAEIINQKKVEADAKVAIAKIQQATSIAVAEITTKAQDAKARAEMEFKTEQIHHDAAHEVAMQAVEHGHAQDMASQQAAVAAQQSDQGHQQALEQQAASQPNEAGQQ